MRIGVFHEAPYYLRYYATTLTELVESGHRLVLARPDRYDEVPVPRGLRKRPEVSAALYPWDRADGREKTAAIVRAARDFARYSAPPLETAYANRARAFERLLRTVIGKARSLETDAEPPQISLCEADCAAIDTLFRDLEDLIPPDEGICRFVREQKLDLVVCVSRVNIAARQTEVVKAAKSLGIPTGIIVYSWDNLSSKGLIHEHPDRLFVWNDVQAREAEQLHDIAADTIVVTGAVRFDPVFDTSPSADRATLLGELGLDPGRKTVLWLGSSAFVSPHEPEFVEEWVARLRTSGNRDLEHANVIVRPHPGTVGNRAWAGWEPPAGSVVPPPVIRDRAHDLYDQLFVSDAVVSLNTSAEIEAAIVGRPVLTIEAGDRAPGQEGCVHYRYLLAEEGGFVERAENLDTHLVQLSRAVASDPLADARHRFLETFVRPLGVDRPAGPILAEAILDLGGSRLEPPGARRRSRFASAFGR
jgi:hypothetical protein